MIGINLPRKRSEQGASLLLLVSIIGLAFIVTVAGFLAATSADQDIARLASTKVDIATREDALMREVLQQTAMGMAPNTTALSGVTGAPQTWTQIMTSATNNLIAITYVNPAEITALTATGTVFPANMVPANLADTGTGTPLSIFQGYSQEKPWGGTSVLANSVSLDVANPYNSNVEPPLLTWPGTWPPAVTLVPATALTTPQEFFLGSQYPTSSTPATSYSASFRWSQMIYPNVRFGYKQPGNLFITRQVWWRIPVNYATQQQTVEDQGGATPVYRYPSVTANYVLSVYEIPSQLPISGATNLQIGTNQSGTAWGSAITVTGSIYGDQIQLASGTYGSAAQNNGISSREGVTISGTSNVGGVAYTGSIYDNPGTREVIDQQNTTIGAAPVSEARNDGKVLIVPVMPGNQFYMQAPSNAPTHWDLYARPYYKCRIRLIISGTNPTLVYNSVTGATNSTAPAGAITVDVYTYADTASPAQPDQILGFPDIDAIHTKYVQGYSGDTTGNGNSAYAWPSAPIWMTYTSTGTGTGPAPGGSDRNLLVIDVPNMVQTLGSGSPSVDDTQLYSIYIGSTPLSEPESPFTTSDPGVAITDTQNLSTFTSGLSIVTNQTLYFLDYFNQVNMAGSANPPSTSIYAPQVLYGASGVTSAVNLKGQISVDAASSGTPGPTVTPVYPLSLSNATGTVIPATNVTGTFGEITFPTQQLPPITRLNLMFTIEKERTH